MTVGPEQALCQEVARYAEDPSFDLFSLIPAPTNTPADAGPYITPGMCYVSHPDSRVSDITIHRLCLQSRDELSIFFTPGIRHIGAMAARAGELGLPLPISISIGVDPAIEIASCFEPPSTPLGYDELAVDGALRGRAVEMVRCLTIEERAVANAEYVIEGELLPGVRVREDQNRNTGCAMPEFPGYTGPASDSCGLIKVKAVTHRRNQAHYADLHRPRRGTRQHGRHPHRGQHPGPGRAGHARPPVNVYSATSGGGKYMAVLQFRKKLPSDEGRQRQAALLAFSAFAELKHVILVDEDVDIFDANDVFWALNARYQGDVDTIFIPGVRCRPLDPSQSPEYSCLSQDRGITCKTIFDCTVPFKLKDKFKRAAFMEVDPGPAAPEPQRRPKPPGHGFDF